MRVALVATIRNEADSIREFLESVFLQTRVPDEVVITDGGSTDGTPGIVQAYAAEGHPVLLEVMPGANRSRGRNRAVEVAQAEVIAVTDAGCRLAPDWLESIVRPFEEAPPATAVAGFYSPTPWNAIEACIGAMTLPGLETVEPEQFLPSSRSVAFTRQAWRDAGGYPEHLDLNEDTPFDLSLIAAGHRFRFEPRAIVYWRPRPDAQAVFRQFRSYARGDAQARILGSTYAHIYGRYLALALGLTLWALTGTPALALAGLPPSLMRLNRDLRKVARKVRHTEFGRRPVRWRVLASVMPIRLAIDWGDMVGYAQGRADRVRWGVRGMS